MSDDGRMPPRYGFDVNGYAKQMHDGYWTPWHIAKDTITALRAEVEEWRRLYERAEASIQYGYAPEADQLRSQLSARRRRRAGLERGEEVPAAHQGE
jgi:hypothetical protein